MTGKKCATIVNLKNALATPVFIYLCIYFVGGRGGGGGGGVVRGLTLCITIILAWNQTM